MTSTARPEPRRPTGHRIWVPRQHGAWAMLLLPVLLGVAASRPDAWHLALAGAALTGYLASSTLQAWSRARRPPAYRAPLTVYGTAFAMLGLLLTVAFPALLATLVVVIPTSLIVFRGARPGSRRDLANSLAQVAQALVLVPAAACVSGEFEPARVIASTLVAAGYLVGTVLMVRSVLRERGNEAFAALAAGFHVVLVVVAAVALPIAYAVLGLGLTGRAIALPVLQRRLAASPRPLRPIHVGIVEIVSSVAVVVVAFAAPV
ncbi:MAG: YwiC-like family protein [Candidatus Limnocylindrales bacterium]